jgi:hypothetical protein
MTTVNSYEKAARLAGWELRTFGNGVAKWWNPQNDDGSRYVNNERASRYICEDYGIKPE